MRTRTGISILIVLLLVGTLRAVQVPRAEIRGTVTDTSGAVLPGVTVSLTEIVPAGTKTEALDLPPLKYQRAPEIPPIDAANARYATELLP